MKDYPSVSVIMSSNGRLSLLKNTLESWADMDYPEYEFIFIDNGSPDEQALRQLTDVYKDRLQNFSYERISGRIINQVWNHARRKSKNDFVVFSMADEIVSSKQLLKEMVSCPRDTRCSVNTYFLNQEMTHRLVTIDWKSNPKLIEEFPGFWTGDYYQNTSNAYRKAAGLITHITGQSRENWEYFGWFIDLPDGHLWIDQNVHLREQCLGKGCFTVPNVVCYHQWHPELDISRRPGFHYKTEREARLLDEAERDSR